MRLSRREFLGAAALFPAGLSASGRIESIEPARMLVGECSLAGELRADDVVPAHPNGLPLARDRWLLLYATRGFRGVDDDRSIVWQIRRDGPDGTVVREGLFARTRDDWDPHNQGKAFSRQQGHPVAFGVPKGARIGGKPAPHANVFVARWYVSARLLDRARNHLEHSTADIGFAGPRLFVEGVQFRLNEAGDDLEILRPAARLRQKGFESGERFTSAEGATWMNQSFTPAVPFNREASEWADAMAFDGGRLAAAKHRWDPASGLYEWVETGPFLAHPEHGLSEGSLARLADGWAVSARAARGGACWAKTEDPFRRMPVPVHVAEPATTAPLTAFACPDGVLRLLTGDKGRRDPLFMWDVLPGEGFRAANVRTVFDSVKAGLPIRPASQPKVDMAKLLPPQGRTQLLAFRVSIRSFNHPYPNRPAIPVAGGEEKAACGIYAARLTYAEAARPLWSFD